MADIEIKTFQPDPSEETKQSPFNVFIARVRSDRAKGLRPAGQVYPPPTPEKKKESSPPDEFPSGYS